MKPALGTRQTDNVWQKEMLNRHCFKFALEYAIRRVQVNQKGFELNVTHHILFDANVITLITLVKANRP
jgi:hypothetical protein